MVLEAAVEVISREVFDSQGLLLNFAAESHCSAAIVVPVEEALVVEIGQEELGLVAWAQACEAVIELVMQAAVYLIGVNGFLMEMMSLTVVESTLPSA